MINLKIGKEEELLEETDIPAIRNIMDNEIPPSMNIGNESGYECSKEIGKAEMKERKGMGEEKPAVQEEMAEKKDSPVEGKQLPASSNIKEHEIEDDSWEIEAMRTQEIYEEQVRSEDKKDNQTDTENPTYRNNQEGQEHQPTVNEQLWALDNDSWENEAIKTQDEVELLEGLNGT